MLISKHRRFLRYDTDSADAEAARPSVVRTYETLFLNDVSDITESDEVM